jgi:hypothetical protein
MNKILSLVAVVALTATLSFAQDMNLGIRAAINANSVTTGNGKEIDDKYGIGMGGGGGLVAVIPISGNFAARTGAEFIYRTLYNMDMDLPGGDKISASEFALSIPATIQYNNFLVEGLWFGVGGQLDIPFATKVHIGDNSSDAEDRSAVDFGIIGWFGYSISQNIVLDIRSTIVGLALTKPSSKEGDKSSLYHSSCGLTYLF